VRFRGTVRPARWQSLVAIVAVWCVVAALAGSWAVRSAATLPSNGTVAASQNVTDTVGAVIDLGQLRDDAILQPANRFDSWPPNGPSSDKQRSFKTAGIKRDRPPSWSRAAPPEWSLPTPSSLTAPAYGSTGWHSRVTAPTVSGKELLSRIGVARC
jgi:hypothetical protein